MYCNKKRKIKPIKKKIRHTDSDVCWAYSSHNTVCYFVGYQVDMVNGRGVDMVAERIFDGLRDSLGVHR